MTKKDHKNYKISICFYGITRDLSITYPSIKKNIIDPAKKYADVKIFCHFFKNEYISNRRSGESKVKAKNNWEILKADKIIYEKPNIFLKNINLDIHKLDDFYGDDHQSIKNLFHQLYSLDKVFKLSKAFKSQLTLFIRPDLFYWESFEDVIKENLTTLKDYIIIPNWQSYNGLNDRFSICCSFYSASIYSGRINQISNFLKDTSHKINSEELLYYSIYKSNSKIKIIGHKASRVRSNGLMKNEKFETGKFRSQIRANIINEDKKFKILLKKTLEFNSFILNKVGTQTKKQLKILKKYLMLINKIINKKI